MLSRPTELVGTASVGPTTGATRRSSRFRWMIAVTFAIASFTPTAICRLLGQTVTPRIIKENEEAPNEETKRYEALTKQLSGCALQGHFSVDGRPGELKAERYEIESVKKLPTGDLWLFKVRIRYGDHDVNVPLPLTVRWAGTTPVIVVDQLTIPGLGTFDSRVVITQHRYAGTWQHGDTGGHLFGKIVRADDNKNQKPDSDVQADETETDTE